MSGNPAIRVENHPAGPGNNAIEVSLASDVPFGILVARGGACSELSWLRPAGLRQAILRRELQRLLQRDQGGVPAHTPHRQLSHGPGCAHRALGLVRAGPSKPAIRLPLELHHSWQLLLLTLLSPALLQPACYQHAGLRRGGFAHSKDVAAGVPTGHEGVCGEE